ncbi:MAG: deoxynucleoside kinase [Clostridia bacterium]
MHNKYLIAIDGLDGSGKETQTKLLLEYFSAQNIPYKYLTFPTYHDDWSRLVKLYLDGGFGQNPESVNAYAASTFFAADRYCSFMIDWKSDYNNGTVIVCNRYTTGNAVHQLSKLPRDEWDSFINWLNDYEFNRLGLPKPDLVFYLCLPANIARKHITLRNKETGRKLDIHEKSPDHLEKSYEAAVYSANKMGWHTIDCAKDDDMRSIQSIQDDIVKIVKENLAK